MVVMPYRKAQSFKSGYWCSWQIILQKRAVFKEFFKLIYLLSEVGESNFLSMSSKKKSNINAFPTLRITRMQIRWDDGYELCLVKNLEVLSWWTSITSLNTQK
jgi:hypothetical protein